MGWEGLLGPMGFRGFSPARSLSLFVASLPLETHRCSRRCGGRDGCACSVFALGLRRKAEVCSGKAPLGTFAMF